MATDCGCPDVYPDWDDKDVDLGGYPVHHLSIPTLIHMPLAFDVYLSKQQNALEKMALTEIWPRLILTRTGMFRGSLTRILKPGMSSMSRHFRVLPCPFVVRGMLHHGNLSTGHKAIREMQMRLVEEGCRPRELYIAYLSCPACSDRRGEKILFLRRWTDSSVLKDRRLNRRTAITTPEAHSTIESPA